MTDYKAEQQDEIEAIESIYIMKTPEAWDRFMRFMERYGQTNGLVFTKAN